MIRQIYEILIYNMKANCIRCLKDFIPRNGNCNICTDCKKPNKCIHNTTKGRCKIDGCFGNEICEHKEHKQKCHICKPGVKILDKLNNILRKLIKNICENKPIKIRENTKLFIINIFYLNTFDDVINIWKNKIEIYEKHYNEKLNLSYYQIDHVKPKSKFNLLNTEDFSKCCHYSNLQIVNKKDNLRKNNKWTDEDDLFWNNNILYKNYNNIY